MTSSASITVFTANIPASVSLSGELSPSGNSPVISLPWRTLWNDDGRFVVGFCGNVLLENGVSGFAPSGTPWQYDLSPHTLGIFDHENNTAAGVCPTRLQQKHSFRNIFFEVSSNTRLIS